MDDFNSITQDGVHSETIDDSFIDTLANPQTDFVNEWDDYSYINMPLVKTIIDNFKAKTLTADDILAYIDAGGDVDIPIGNSTLYQILMSYKL